MQNVTSIKSAKKSAEKAPPVAVATPVVVGTLDPEEIQKLTDLRAHTEQILRQIGLNRIQEQKLLQQLQNVERAAQVTLNQVGARLGIPDGTEWQVTPEGQAITVKITQTPKV